MNVSQLRISSFFFFTFVLAGWLCECKCINVFQMSTCYTYFSVKYLNVSVRPSCPLDPFTVDAASEVTNICIQWCSGRPIKSSTPFWTGKHPGNQPEKSTSAFSTKKPHLNLFLSTVHTQNQLLGQIYETHDCFITWFWNRKIRNEWYADAIWKSFIVLSFWLRFSVYKTKQSFDIQLRSCRFSLRPYENCKVVMKWLCPLGMTLLPTQ